MGFLVKTSLILALLVVVWMTFNCCNPPKAPQVDPEEYWGPAALKGKQDDSIRPFQIKFSPEMIKDLRQRLQNHRPWTPALQGVAFTYGFNSGSLDSWIEYWFQKYNFTEREKFLNQFPQFKTNIQGLDIHFIRVKPEVPLGVQVVPLLLLHGWPGSVREFYEVIPLLTTKNPGYDFVFEVIVPSLPGYGFSDGAARPGLSSVQMAVIMRNLMQRLGFNKFYVQGGDAGAVVAADMATIYPDDILGHHSNMAFLQESNTVLKTVFGSLMPSLVVDSDLADRMYPLSTFFSYLLEEFGYMHIQATKPDTVSTALQDSPSGLLAYILEKFSTWTRLEHRNVEDGAIEFRFTKDQLIDNLMIYWSSGCITTSMRLYAESFTKKKLAMNMDAIPTKVPTWALQAKHELFYQPAHMLRSKYVNLLNTTVLDDGGHFLAFELPKVFSEDVFKAVQAFRTWWKVQGKTEL